ncbi:unnamed protein product [Paramecium primaurelia]|uniref:Uncharacterized protein n=1 Tax=Paramecium primaurelia TaxID=5886 RepID=A0A8S1LKD2_PARPR|nr:unnamed protein product [Paramecium primaurelia]
MKNTIKYICLLDSKNAPIICRNYENFDEAFIELIINTQCDLIELAYQISPNNGFMGQIGILNELKIFGFMSMTENKIIMICTKEEKRPKDILKQIYDLYRSYILNPFFDEKNLQDLLKKIDDCITAYNNNDE